MRPILFNVGSVPVHSYTVLMLTAFLLVGWLSIREAKRRNRLTDDVLLVGSATLLGAVLGAKLGMLVFLGPAEFWRLLPTIPAHGATLVGGITGGYLTSVLVERALKMERCTGDLIAPFLPLGQAIGRLGDFLAADAYGAPSNLPWAVYQAGAYRHPAQLYELVLDLAFFVFLQRWRRRSFRDGEIFRVYLFGYALIRFPIEFLRYQPTPLYFLGLTLVQWLCLAAIATFGIQLYAQRKGVKCVCDLLPRFPRKTGISAAKELTDE